MTVALAAAAAAMSPLAELSVQQGGPLPVMSGAVLVWGALCIWVVMSLIMAMAWGVALRSGNAGWIDVFWTFGLGLVGVAAALVPAARAMTPALPTVAHIVTFPSRAAFCGALIGIWALRLGLHIARRTDRNGDDPRYAQLREEWGGAYRFRLFVFLQIQALAGVPLLVAVMVAAARPGGFGDVQDIAALVIAVIAIVGEAAADRALREFAAKPGRHAGVCEIGLWKWSRHPNYFFEWVNWLVWPVLAINVVHYPWGWWTLFAPVLMYVLLVHVSGIPPLEAHMARSRGAAWHSYAKRTSAFFPRRPRRSI
jgi:steroid 5-alpha reductase family enzyme